MWFTSSFLYVLSEETDARDCAFPQFLGERFWPRPIQAPDSLLSWERVVNATYIGSLVPFSAILRFLLVSTCVCPCGPVGLPPDQRGTSAVISRGKVNAQLQRAPARWRQQWTLPRALRTYGMNRRRFRTHAGCSVHPPDTAALWSGVCRVKRHCDHSSKCLSFTVLMSCEETSRDCVVRNVHRKQVEL